MLKISDNYYLNINHLICVSITSTSSKEHYAVLQLTDDKTHRIKGKSKEDVRRKLRELGVIKNNT